jgi:hypothetical protein
MSTDQTPDPELAARLAWINTARRLHRNKRIIGLVGVVLGACLVVWWKLDATVQDWALWTGIAVLVVSWAIFVFVIIARWMWVKKNPYKPPAA